MPAFYPENNTPALTDSEQRILNKILGTLQDGIAVTGVTLNGDVSVGALSMDQSTPGTTNGVVVNASALPTGAATQATLASILAALSDPATSAKQDTGNASLATIASGMATQATLASILVKLADPATQATLAALNAKVTAMNSGATVVSASALPTGAATEASLAALNAKVTAMDTGAVTIASGSVTATDPTVSVAKSTTLAASLIAKNAAGTLMSVCGYNSGPNQWIQVHNSTTVPANGAVPLAVISVPSQSSFFFEWQKGLPCGTGIVLCNSYGADPSTAVAQKTIGSNDCFFTATYI